MLLIRKQTIHDVVVGVPFYNPFDFLATTAAISIPSINESTVANKQSMSLDVVAGCGATYSQHVTKSLKDVAMSHWVVTTSGSNAR